MVTRRLISLWWIASTARSHRSLCELRAEPSKVLHLLSVFGIQPGEASSRFSMQEKDLERFTKEAQTWQALVRVMNVHSVRKQKSNEIVIYQAKRLLSLLLSRPVSETVLCCRLIHHTFIPLFLNIDYWQERKHNMEKVQAMLFILTRMSLRSTQVPIPALSEQLNSFVEYMHQYETDLQELPVVFLAQGCARVGTFAIRKGRYLYDILKSKGLLVSELSPRESIAVMKALQVGNEHFVCQQYRLQLAKQLKDNFFRNMAKYTIMDVIRILYNCVEILDLNCTEFEQVDKFIGRNLQLQPIHMIGHLAASFRKGSYYPKHVQFGTIFLCEAADKFRPAFIHLFHFIVVVQRQRDMHYLKRLHQLMSLPNCLELEDCFILGKALAAYGRTHLCAEVCCFLDNFVLTITTSRPLGLVDSIHLASVVHDLALQSACSLRLFQTALCCSGQWLRSGAIASLAEAICYQISLEQFIPSVQLLFKTWTVYGTDDLDHWAVWRIAKFLMIQNIYEHSMLKALEQFGVRAKTDSHVLRKVLCLLCQTFFLLRFPAHAFYRKLCSLVEGKWTKIHHRILVLTCSIAQGVPLSNMSSWPRQLTVSDIKRGTHLQREYLHLLHLFLQQSSNGKYGLTQDVFQHVQHRKHRRAPEQFAVEKCLSRIEDLLSVKLARNVVTDNGLFVSSVLLLNKSNGEPCPLLPSSEALSAVDIRARGFIPVAILCLDDGHFIRDSSRLLGLSFARCQVLLATNWALLVINLKEWESVDDQRDYLRIRLLWCESNISLPLLADAVQVSSV